jgi:hypothetical protein
LSDWFNWQQDLSDFEELPDWVLYKKWQMIRRSRAKEINDQSRTAAQQVAFFVHYINMKGAQEGEHVEFPDVDLFLPFDLRYDEDKSPDAVADRTIKVMWMASKSGRLPPQIQQLILQTYPEVWQRICNQEIVA